MYIFIYDFLKFFVIENYREKKRNYFCKYVNLSITFFVKLLIIYLIIYMN